MTTQSEMNHYQEQIRALLKAKNDRLAEVAEINKRLVAMGHKSGAGGVNKPKETTKKIVPIKSTNSKKTSTGGKLVPVGEKNQIKILATVKNMRDFLKNENIEFSSQAKKAELEQIIRKNCLVKKLNAFHKKNS